jgi:hypothetical protein
MYDNLNFTSQLVSLKGAYEIGLSILKVLTKVKSLTKNNEAKIFQSVLLVQWII